MELGVNVIVLVPALQVSDVTNRPLALRFSVPDQPLTVTVHAVLFLTLTAILIFQDAAVISAVRVPVFHGVCITQLVSVRVRPVPIVRSESNLVLVNNSAPGLNSPSRSITSIKASLRAMAFVP